MTDSLLRHIDNCTRHERAAFIPLHINGQPLGSIRRKDVAFLIPSGLFRQKADGSLALVPREETLAGRTDALDQAARLLCAHHGVPLTGEIYPVIAQWKDEPLAHIDRAAIPWFGVKGFGVHVNGYVRKGQNLFLWVGTRAKDRRIDPGKLDNLIGGGLPLGYSVRDNLRKEAWEEAGITATMADQAAAQGTISYRRDMLNGVCDSTLFVFDLELPPDFIPQSTDGEVERFDLIPATDVLTIIARTDRFKFNCNVVMLDFMLRHNVIGKNHPEHEALEAALIKIRG